MKHYEQTKKVTTLPEMLEELGSWIATDCNIMINAGNANIDTENNFDFKNLVKAWNKGHYDDDPETLHRRLIELIPVR